MSRESGPSEEEMGRFIKELVGRDVTLPENGFVNAGNEMLSLCPMCQYEPRTCPQRDLFSVLVPIKAGATSNRRYKGDASHHPDRYNPEELPAENGWEWKDAFEVGKYTTKYPRRVWICASFNPKNDFE